MYTYIYMHHTQASNLGAPPFDHSKCVVLEMADVMEINGLNVTSMDSTSANHLIESLQAQLLGICTFSTKKEVSYQIIPILIFNWIFP